METAAIFYSLLICILLIVVVIITSILIRFYILGQQCRVQSSPYCPADPVCPMTDGTPIWMACEAQDIVNKRCGGCTDNNCFSQSGSCPDVWCVNCTTQANCTELCSRFDQNTPTCPGSGNTCVTNVPTT